MILISTTLTLIYKCSNADDLKSEPILLDSSGYTTVKQANNLRKACRYTQKIGINAGVRIHKARK